jgi:hypothetical protein
VTAAAPGSGASRAAPNARRGGLGRIFNRSNWPLLGLILLGGLLLVVSALGSRPAQPIPFDLDSSAASGLRALDLWLQDLGYDVQRIGGMQFRVPQAADLIFVYPNQLSYTAAEAEALHDWVAAGHTAVIVGPHPEDVELERVFGVRSGPRDGFGLTEQQRQPLIPEGASEYSTDWNMGSEALDLEHAPGAVPVLMAENGQVTASIQQIGSGVAWHLTPGIAFVNHGLAEDDHGQLLPPILRYVPPGGTIAFDTYHQFGVSRVGEQIATLQDWLYRTPTGWATFFAFSVFGIFIVLYGRRLGPSVATKAERRRREAAEYVEAMAALARRARLGKDVAQYQQQRLKRGLARRRPLDPNLPDHDFVARLAYSEPALTAEQGAEVRQVLDALRRGPNEQQLVALAAKVDALVKL